METTTTTRKPFEPKKIEEQRFEFVLFINNHIICQRYFNIRDFNDQSLKSYELKELMDAICNISNNYGQMGIIPKHLKAKAVDYLWSFYNPFSLQQDQPLKNLYDKIDDFQFEIKVDKKTVAKTTFSGNLFPQKVRYAVDIKEIIPAIMAEIREYLSRKNYTKVTA